MVENRDSLLKIIIPTRNKLLGCTTRLFLAGTILTGSAYFLSRNQGNEASSQIQQMLLTHTLSLSPDGKNITYVETKFDGSRELQVMDAYGNTKKLLAAGRDDYLELSKWSPIDNGKILIGFGFSMRKNGGAQVELPDEVSGVYVVDVVTGELTALNEDITQGQRIDSRPRWSQGGHRIIFERENGTYSINSNGTNLQPFFGN